MAYNPPFTYQVLNSVDGMIHPSFLHINDTQIARVFKRYLLQDAISVYDFTLPDSIDADAFRYWLIGCGFVAVLKTDLFGIIAQPCSLSGRNVYYMPTRAIVANPLLQARELRIGKDCEIIKVQPDFGSILDIIDNYGNMMALIWQCAAVNVLNSHMSYTAYSTSKAEAEAYKKGYDQIASGIPLVVYHEGSKKPPDDSQGMRLLTQNVGQNFITPDLIESLQNVQAAFRAEIGIPNLLVRKKERLLTDEVNKGDIYTRSKAELWLDEMRAGMKKCVELFPELDGKLWVDFSQNLNGGAEDGGNNVNFGTV